MIGRESILSFWFDNWSHKGPLRHLIQGPLPLGVADWKVKDVAAIRGWNGDIAPFDIPHDLKMEFQAIPYAFAASSKARLMWRDSPRGDFSMRSAYNMAVGADWLPDFNGGWIWKLHVLPKIQLFLWKCTHNSIGVKDCLAARGVTIDPLCPLCRKEPESIVHALRNCEKIRAIWNELDAMGFDRNFFSSTAEDWMAFNGKMDKAKNQHSPPWNIIFSFAVWNIWKNRNHVIFKGRYLNPRLANLITNQALEFFFCAGSSKAVQNQVLNMVKWDRPGIGWMKLNTDGSSLGNPGSAGGGGVIRDWHGRWVASFSRKIGIASSLLAELWAIHDRLMLCIDRNLAMVEVKLDAKAVVDVLANPLYSNNAISPLIEDCRFFISQIPHVRIKHCYCEADRCADKLARLGANQNVNFICYEEPPGELGEIVEADCNGVSIARQCLGAFVVP